MSYTCSRVFVLFFAVAMTAGCATWNPFARESAGEATTSQGRQPYYTAEAGVKLYSEPRLSESYIAELPLHQKVYRTTLERGFAYVEVEGSSQKGWVDNGKLIWRLPAAAHTAPAAGGNAVQSDTVAKPAATPEGVPAIQAPAAPAPQVAGEVPGATKAPADDAVPPEETDGADPSLFSPF